MTAGLRTIEFESPRGMVQTLVFYPATAPEAAFPLGDLPVSVAPDAEPAPGRYPVVVLVHGSGSRPALWRGLARDLALAGFVVAIARQPGDNRTDGSLTGTETNLLLRPVTLSATLLAVFQDPALAAVTDPERSFAIGHAMGAHAALVAAGALAVSQQEESPDGQPHRMPPHNEPFLKAIALLNPAAAWFDSPGALDKVALPVLMINGDSDDIAVSWHADVIRRGLVSRGLLTDRLVKGAGHFSFMTPFPPEMTSATVPQSQDPAGFDRAAFQPHLASELAGFFRRHGA